MESDLVLIVVALVALSVLSMIRACRESERVALNTPQRFVKLKGPGLFLQLPWPVSPYCYTRVRIGDRGRYVDNDWAEIGGKKMPVTPVEAVTGDVTVQVTDFVDQQIFVVPVNGA